MTLVAGFLCHDGIVLAADRQMTSTTYTFPDVKLNSLRWVKGRAIWGYSGNLDTANRLEREFQSEFGQFSQVSRHDLSSFIEKALKKALKRREHFYTLFGAAIEGEQPCLFVSDGKRVAPVSRCEIIGSDSSSIRYLRGLFLRSLSTSVNRATVFAIYLLSQAKKYDGQWIGGGTDICLIDSTGYVKVMDAPQTQTWEGELDIVQSWTVNLFSFLSDPDISPEWIDRRFKEFREKAESFCEKVRGIK